MAELGKRRYDFGGELVPLKKQKNELVAVGAQRNEIIQSGPARSSALQSPIMLLSGHGGEVFTAKFHPQGETVTSAGFDRLICKLNLWNVFGECENFAVLKGHTGAIMELQYFSDGSTLVSCSTDKTVACWDYETGMRIKRLKGHASFVNSCCPARRGPELIVSGSDDGTIKLWDRRRRNALSTFQNNYQVTSVCFNDTSDQVFSGGIDNTIKVWDLRKNDVLYKMRGHTDTVTGFKLSPDGSFLLSNGMDNTVRVWDIRPYAPTERCIKVFTGAQHNFEKNLIKCCWSPDGRFIASGSADRYVYVWDTVTRKVVYKLPGHNGSVNDVDFHPTEPIRK
eukprot:gene12164-13419_t